MRPFFLFDGFFVFRSAFVDGAFGFSYIDGCRFTRAMEFVDAFSIAWVGPSLVFAAYEIPLSLCLADRWMRVIRNRTQVLVPTR